MTYKKPTQYEKEGLKICKYFTACDMEHSMENCKRCEERKKNEKD